MKKKIFTIYLPLLIAGLVMLLTLFCFRNSNSEPSESLPESETTESHASILEDSHLGIYTDPETERTMEYHIYFPENATEQMPLVVYLHGTGTIGNSSLNEDNPAIRKAREIYGEDFPFILLAPSSMFKSSWRLNHTPDMVKALIDDTVKKYNIDQTKIIIIGHSMGAGGVMRQVELFGDFYSAAVPVSLTSTDNIDVTKCVDVPIWGFAGTEESPHEYNMKKLFQKINKSGGKAMLSALEGVEHGDSAEYAFTRDMFEWALAQ